MQKLSHCYDCIFQDHSGRKYQHEFLQYRQQSFQQKKHPDCRQLNDLKQNYAAIHVRILLKEAVQTDRKQWKDEQVHPVQKNLGHIFCY